eukprot:GFUD01082068.1.p1 GENE.GFUD01082068.1~~GFUD01082068.1.p1  ORF type:complete len:404 (-),score=84.18 GFUD01082068.1:111-1322(-)
MTVVNNYRNIDTQATWTLRISQAIEADSGEYKCQVNTEPAISAAFMLNVRSSNLREKSHTLDLISASSFEKTVKEKLSVVELHVNDADSESLSEHEKKLSSGKDPQNMSVLSFSTDQTYNPETDAAEGPIYVKEMNATESKLESKIENLMSILLPLCSLIVIFLVVIVLGSLRVFYSWKLNPRGNSRRSRSRSVTLERRQSSGSLRSTGSRRSRDSVNSHTSKISNRKEREWKRERGINKEMSENYGPSPLHEMAKPTCELNSKKPIFLIVRVDGLEKEEISNYNESPYMKSKHSFKGSSVLAKTHLKDMMNETKESQAETEKKVSNRTNEKKHYTKTSTGLLHSEVTESYDISDPDNAEVSKAMDKGSTNGSCASLSQLSCGSTVSVYVETSKVISVQRFTI